MWNRECYILKNQVSVVGSDPTVLLPGVSDPDYKYADPCRRDVFVMLV